MKKVAKARWAHPICALFSDSVEVECGSPLKLVLAREVNVQGGSACVFCHWPGGQKWQCMNPSCTRWSHVYCALSARAQAAKENSAFEGGWQMQLELEPELFPGRPTTQRQTDPQKKAEAEAKPGDRDGPKALAPGDVDWLKGGAAGAASRGGKLKVWCEVHKPPRENCFCAQKPGGSKDAHTTLISCEKCGTQAPHC